MLALISSSDEAISEVDDLTIISDMDTRRPHFSAARQRALAHVITATRFALRRGRLVLSVDQSIWSEWRRQPMSIR